MGSLCESDFPYPRLSSSLENLGTNLSLYRDIFISLGVSWCTYLEEQLVGCYIAQIPDSLFSPLIDPLRYSNALFLMMSSGEVYIFERVPIALAVGIGFRDIPKHLEVSGDLIRDYFRWRLRVGV